MGAAVVKLCRRRRPEGSERPGTAPIAKADARSSPWGGCPAALDGNPLAADGHPLVRDSSSLPRDSHLIRMHVLPNRNSVHRGIEPMSTQRIATLAALLLAVICFLYVWPGVLRYRYENGPYRIRVDRLTGQVQEWRQYGSLGVEVVKPHWHGKEPCPLCKNVEAKTNPQQEAALAEAARDFVQYQNSQRKAYRQVAEEIDAKTLSKVKSKDTLERVQTELWLNDQLELRLGRFPTAKDRQEVIRMAEERLSL